MIKTYEGFFNKIREKLPQNRLAQAFVDLFNNINPKVISDYTYGVTKDHIFVKVDNMKVLYIDSNVKLFDESIFKIALFFEHKKERKIELPDNIQNFIQSVFTIDNSLKRADGTIRFEGTVFKIKEKQIPEIISKLSIENYDLFNDTNNYNL